MPEPGPAIWSIAHRAAARSARESARAGARAAADAPHDVVSQTPGSNRHPNVRPIAHSCIALLLFGCTSAPGTRDAAPPPAGAPQTHGPLATAPVACATAVDASNVAMPPPAAASVSAPAYDLAADRSRIIEQMQGELGPRTRPAVVGEVYVVAGPPGSGVIDSSVPFIERVLEAYHNGRFRARPPKAIGIYLFPDATSYERYCQARFSEHCMSIYGFFSPEARALVMNIGLGIGTLSHELVHPILEADFPHAPTWINEGIASLYEAPVMPRRGEIHGRKNWRYPRLQAALSSPRQRAGASLPELFRMSDEQFRGVGEDLHYAMARYLCQWLDQHAQLWPFYQQWRDHYEADRFGEKAFEAAVGRTPADANDAWVRWVLSLTSAG